MFKPHFRKLKHIKSYRHFMFDSSTPGVVCCKAVSDSEVELIDLLKTWSPTASDLPPQIYPAGLSLERQWYLYKHIREYCSIDAQDKVCPKPLVPLTTASSASLLPSTSVPGPTFSTTSHNSSTGQEGTIMFQMQEAWP